MRQSRRVDHELRRRAALRETLLTLGLCLVMVIAVAIAFLRLPPTAEVPSDAQQSD